MIVLSKKNGIQYFFNNQEYFVLGRKACTILAKRKDY